MKNIQTHLHRWFPLACAIMLASATVTPASAAPPEARAATETTPPTWEKLSQTQRDAILSMVRERWDANPRQRAKTLQHAERWQQMTPEQRSEARQGQRRWEQMSPEQRKAARAEFEQHRGLPPEQRETMRETLKEMTPEQRREWMRAHRPEHGRAQDLRQAPASNPPPAQ